MTQNPRLVGRSGCPIATTLDLLGDAWSLVLIRDMLNGKRRFNQFLESPEGITTSILTSRLNRLEQGGLIRKRPYQKRPTRYDYTLTPKGRALHPVLQQICRWANRHYPGTWTPPASFMVPPPDFS